MFGFGLSKEEKATIEHVRRVEAIQVELNKLSEQIEVLRTKQRTLTKEYDELVGA